MLSILKTSLITLTIRSRSKEWQEQKNQKISVLHFLDFSVEFSPVFVLERNSLIAMMMFTVKLSFSTSTIRTFKKQRKKNTKRRDCIVALLYCNGRVLSIWFCSLVYYLLATISTSSVHQESGSNVSVFRVVSLHSCSLMFARWGSSSKIVLAVVSMFSSVSTFTLISSSSWSWSSTSKKMCPNSNTLPIWPSIGGFGIPFALAFVVCFHYFRLFVPTVAIPKKVRQSDIFLQIVFG